MKSKVISNPKAQELIHKGVNIIADAVETSLSPVGRNVGISHAATNGEIYLRESLHDGVKIAHAVDLMDESENFGAQILKEAAQKQVDVVGDGTTAVICLARAIYNECYTMIAAGQNPMLLVKGLNEGLMLLINEIENYTTPIKNFKEMEQIATISAEDEELGTLVAKTFEKIGVDGVVTIEESHLGETKVEYQEGMQLDKGYAHPLFMTDPERLEATYENAYFLITDKSIASLEDLGELLNTVHSRSASLVIISPSIAGEALPLLVQNKLGGKLQVLAITAPGMGQNQKETLHDLAILTGAKFITEDAGHEFKEIVFGDLGRAEYISSTKNATIISGGKGKKVNITQRITEIKKRLSEEESDYEIMKLKERLAKLTNGVAVIKVGGATEIEMKERRERIDDAVHATRAAMKKGIVIGGEIIYLRVRKVLDQSISHRILYRALEKPFIKLVENSGENGGRIQSELERQPKNTGYDVMDGTFKDFMKAGIVDPSLVSTEALRNAISVAITLMTTDVLIPPDKEDKK